MTGGGGGGWRRSKLHVLLRNIINKTQHVFNCARKEDTQHPQDTECRQTGQPLIMQYGHGDRTSAKLN